MIVEFFKNENLYIFQFCNKYIYDKSVIIELKICIMMDNCNKLKYDMNDDQISSEKAINF